MIGDWVSVNGKPCKVTAFASRQEETRNSYEAGFARTVQAVVQSKVGTYGTVEMEDIEPLPLTKGILLANQWKADGGKLSKGNYYKDMKNPYFPTLWEAEGGFYMFLGGRETDVKSVHELQHIMRVHKNEREIRPWKK